MISKLRLLFCLTACLAVLFAPLLLGISLDGKAYAMGFLGSNPDNNDSPNIVSGPAPQVQHAPEPATLLLFGAGVVSLVAVRKKFKKK